MAIQTRRRADQEPEPAPPPTVGGADGGGGFGAVTGGAGEPSEAPVRCCAPGRACSGGEGSGGVVTGTGVGCSAGSTNACTRTLPEPPSLSTARMYSCLPTRVVSTVRASSLPSRLTFSHFDSLAARAFRLPPPALRSRILR